MSRQKWKWKNEAADRLKPMITAEQKMDRNNLDEGIEEVENERETDGKGKKNETLWNEEGGRKIGE